MSIPTSYHTQLQKFLQKDLNDAPFPKDKEFLDHLFEKIDAHLKAGGKILLLTLTKKLSEDITNFLLSKGYKAFYLHSEIDTLKRRKIIKKLKSGQIDILVGINLLREGIDLPEVSFIGLLDADKEGFLRSETALIQNIGRAARHPKGEVVLYANAFTASMTKALYETHRRRGIQQAFNEKHNITPVATRSNIKDLESVKTDEDLSDLSQSFSRFGPKNKKLTKMTKKEKQMIHKDLKQQLDEAIKKRNFEQATILRDQIQELMEERV